MKKIWDRLMTYRMNKELWKRMILNKRMGLLNKENHHLIQIGANLVFVTFFIRLASRIFMKGNLFFNDHPQSDWTLFLKENIISLGFLALVYILFSNYLLGISLKDPKVKRYPAKYIKILFFLILYLIEIGVSFFYFINTLYDYYLISCISLLSLIGTLYAYFIIFISVLDFCIYNTDNSDDKKELNGDVIDYF